LRHAAAAAEDDQPVVFAHIGFPDQASGKFGRLAIAGLARNSEVSRKQVGEPVIGEQQRVVTPAKAASAKTAGSVTAGAEALSPSFGSVAPPASACVVMTPIPKPG